MRLSGLSWTQLGLVFAVAGGLTVLLYLLRQQRRSVTVPHLWFWQATLMPKRTARLLARLKQWLSLLLALSIALALVLALGDPRLDATAGDARRSVLLIDASPSMATPDEQPDRLTAAKALARRAVLSAEPGEHMLIVQLAETPTAVSTLTQDRDALLDAIERVSLQPTEADLNAALGFAGNVLEERRGRVLVFSDGRTKHGGASVPPLQVPVSYAPVGDATGNLAITRLSVRRYPLDKNNHETLVELVNTGDAPARATLELHSGGHPVLREPLSLPAGTPVRRIFENLAGVERILEARIVAERPDADALPTDSRAYATLPAHRRASVLCVTRGSLYLQAALLVDEYLRVDVVSPGDYRGPGDHDVVIFDDFVPERPPGRPALYLHPGEATPGNPLDIRGRVEQPFFDRLERAHPLLRWTALSDVNIAQALRLRPEPADEVVGGDAGVPLLVAGERDGVPFVATAFRVEDSDLPLRVAFPLLLLNIIDSFVAGRGSAPPPLFAGQPARLEVGGPDRPLPVQGPEGPVPGQVSRSTLRFVPSGPGVYRLPAMGGAAGEPIAANFGPDVNPEIAPMAELALAEDARAQRFVPAPPRSAEPPWTWLLLLAGALLLFEWWSFHRRWTV